MSENSTTEVTVRMPQEMLDVVAECGDPGEKLEDVILDLIWIGALSLLRKADLGL